MILIGYILYFTDLVYLFLPVVDVGVVGEGGKGGSRAKVFQFLI